MKQGGRAVDTLGVMHRRGSISLPMRQAGERFRNAFAVAQLDPIGGNVDLVKGRIDRNAAGFARLSDATPGQRVERARAEVWGALLAVGGLHSPGGSCLWHVAGWERTVKEWAFDWGWSGHRVSQEAASGILIAALGVLETHFAGRPGQ